MIFGRGVEGDGAPHDVPIKDFSGPMLVNEGEQIDRIARTAADIPVTFDRGTRSSWQVA